MSISTTPVSRTTVRRRAAAARATASLTLVVGAVALAVLVVAPFLGNGWPVPTVAALTFFVVHRHRSLRRGLGSDNGYLVWAAVVFVVGLVLTGLAGLAVLLLVNGVRYRSRTVLAAGGLVSVSSVALWNVPLVGQSFRDLSWLLGSAGLALVLAVLAIVARRRESRMLASPLPPEADLSRTAWLLIADSDDVTVEGVARALGIDPSAAQDVVDDLRARSLVTTTTTLAAAMPASTAGHGAAAGPPSTDDPGRASHLPAG